MLPLDQLFPLTRWVRLYRLIRRDPFVQQVQFDQSRRLVPFVQLIRWDPFVQLNQLYLFDQWVPFDQSVL